MTTIIAVAEVVFALDGMPLAGELAAARASTLSPPELAARLTDRFGLLTSGARTADARQRSLRATVDWSHDLHTEPEQIVFRRLAVLHGGCTLDAAEAVTSGTDVHAHDLLDVLTRLVDRHMVTVDDVHPGQPSRFRCWRRFASTRPRSSPTQARRTRWPPRTSRTSAAWQRRPSGRCAVRRRR